jgi:ABC-type amino acid transport substrate-binding protein
MKKFLLPVAALIAAASLHSADDLKSNVGIGIGTMIFEGQSGLLSQICAATTNGCFGNQTFAITTGTLGARPWTGIVSNGEVQTFVRENMDQLAREIAAGQGESVDTLAELIAVPAGQRADFAKTLQAKFDVIYSSPTVTSTEVVEHIAQVVPKV